MTIPIDMNIPPEQAALELFTNPQIGLQSTLVVTPGKNTSTEVELFASNILLKCGKVYGLWINDSGKNVYKLRGELTPKYKDFGLGVTAQHLDGFFPQHDEIGIIAKIPLKTLKGMIDIRYFPETDIVDGFGIMNFSTKSVAKVLAEYNTKTGAGYVRPGIEYKISDNFSVGARHKFPIEQQKFTKQSLRNSKENLHLYLSCKF